MKRVAEIEGVTVPPPFSRTIKLVFSPGQDPGIQGFTFAVTVVSPNGGQTNVHVHEACGELMYFLSGLGECTLGDTTVELAPEVAVYAPAGVPHQIRNLSAEPMKIAAVFVPPLPAEYLQGAVRAVLAAS